MQVEEPLDIFLSHDWPIGITDCGNSTELIRQKPFFEKEVMRTMLINWNNTRHGQAVSPGIMMM